MWDLSVSFINSSLKFFPGGLDEAFKNLKEIGFDAVCPSEGILNGDKDGYIKSLKDASKKHGLKINVLHFPILCEVHSSEYLSKKYFDEMVYYIDVAEKMGCKYGVVHPLMPWKREFFADKQTKFDYSIIRNRCEEINFEFFNKLKPYVLNSGLELALENIYTSDMEYKEQLTSGCSDTDEWIKYIDTLGKGFCACLDTGHANLTDRDNDKINQKVIDLGSRLKTLHVNDNTGKFSNYGDFHLLPFEGDIDMISFAKTLKKIGYTGDFNYEVALSIASKEIFLSQLKYLKTATDLIYKSI